MMARDNVYSAFEQDWWYICYYAVLWRMWEIKGITHESSRPGRPSWLLADVVRWRLASCRAGTAGAGKSLLPLAHPTGGAGRRVSGPAGGGMGGTIAGGCWGESVARSGAPRGAKLPCPARLCLAQVRPRRPARQQGRALPGPARPRGSPRPPSGSPPGCHGAGHELSGWVAGEAHHSRADGARRRRPGPRAGAVSRNNTGRMVCSAAAGLSPGRGQLSDTRRRRGTGNLSGLRCAGRGPGGMGRSGGGLFWRVLGMARATLVGWGRGRGERRGGACCRIGGLFPLEKEGTSRSWDMMSLHQQFWLSF